MSDLREKVKDLIFNDDANVEFSVTYKNNHADEIISMVLDEAIEAASAIECNYIQQEDDFIGGKYKAIEAIEKLKTTPIEKADKQRSSKERLTALGEEVFYINNLTYTSDCQKCGSRLMTDGVKDYPCECAYPEDCPVKRLNR